MPPKRSKGIRKVKRASIPAFPPLIEESEVSFNDPVPTSELRRQYVRKMIAQLADVRREIDSIASHPFSECLCFAKVNEAMGALGDTLNGFDFMEGEEL